MAVINQYTSLSITVIKTPAANGPTVVARCPIVEFNAIAFGRIVGDTRFARNAAWAGVKNACAMPWIKINRYTQSSDT